MRVVVLLSTALLIMKFSSLTTVSQQTSAWRISSVNLEDMNQPQVLHYKSTILDAWETFVGNVPGCNDLINTNRTTEIVEWLPHSPVSAIKELYFHLGHKLPQAIAKGDCDLARGVIDQIMVTLVDAQRQLDNLSHALQSPEISQLFERARDNLHSNLVHLGRALMWSTFDLSWSSVPNLSPWLLEHWEYDISVAGQIDGCTTATESLALVLQVSEQDLMRAAQSFRQLGNMLNEFVGVWPWQTNNNDEHWCRKQMIMVRSVCSSSLELFLVDADIAFERCMSSVPR